ncbi:DUF4150 domain-containing protein [Citrobacter rodentium]|uniref:DUF4150 domain-containing protein n=3 Tax=Citrobacter rodentium TaxID=67825 RepID=A0A482PFL2_CITRO|nr:PAAR-like domain-containing protein [Citrobacter rodentium]QBY29288.1 DUF4150 domain-containing protein [Citrobacter rodentium]
MSTKNDGHYFCGAGGNRPDGLNETLTLVVLNQSFVPTTKGDAAGQAKGVKSGTVGGKCYPQEHSKTVRAGKKQILRHGDDFWMNGT